MKRDHTACIVAGLALAGVAALFMALAILLRRPAGQLIGDPLARSG